jgi:acyl-CoA thioesterase
MTTKTPFNPFCEMIGLQFIDLETGFSRCKLDVCDRLLNPHRVLHGAAIYAMADTGMGGALYSHLDEGESCGTIEIKINYLKSVRSGGLFCDSRVIHKTRNIAFLESRIIDAEDRLVATAIGTFFVFRPEGGTELLK